MNIIVAWAILASLGVSFVGLAWLTWRYKRIVYVLALALAGDWILFWSIINVWRGIFITGGGYG